MYVATIDGEVIAFGHYHHGEIMAVYVDPAHARRGVGRLLMAKLEEVARADGATHLHLNAALNSEGFYAACGYARTRETTYRTRGGIAIKCALMEKDL
jgi:GNAT superfamily N-acetyltransferase